MSSSPSVSVSNPIIHAQDKHEKSYTKLKTHLLLVRVSTKYMIAKLLRTEFSKYPQKGNFKTRAQHYNGWKWQKHYQTAFPVQRNQTRYYDNHVEYACTKNTSLHTFFVCFTVKYDSFCCLVVVLSHGVSISTVVISTSANETRDIWTRFSRA